MTACKNCNGTGAEAWGDDCAICGGYGAEPERTDDVRNATPHAVSVAGVVIAPSGYVPRIEISESAIGRVAGHIPLVETRAGGVTGLPPVVPNTRWIVSRAVAEAASDRQDLVVLHGGVRDESGRVVGHTALAQVR